jgi:hypothetical protein
MGRPLVFAGLALAVSLSAGCVVNRVEMPRSRAPSAGAASTGTATAAAATQKGSVAFASARCFLYRRDDSRRVGFMERFNADLERESHDRQGLGLRCGRPIGAGPPPLLARTLVLGETFGFRRDATGRITAIAGEERIPLDEGRYAWELVPLEYTQAQKTAQFIGALFAMAFAPRAQ